MGRALACACISLTMTARCCIHNEKLHLRRAEGVHFDPEILKKAFRIGTPVAVQEIAMNSAMVAATMIIGTVGSRLDRSQFVRSDRGESVLYAGIWDRIGGDNAGWKKCGCR